MINQIRFGTVSPRYGLLIQLVNLLLCVSVFSVAITGCSASGTLIASAGSQDTAISSASSSGDLRISYSVSMDDAVNHNFRVSMTIDGVSTDTLVLKMPVWTPGYYWIQNYPKNLSRLEIRDTSGRECHFLKTSKNVWKVATGGAGYTEGIVGSLWQQSFRGRCLH